MEISHQVVNESISRLALCVSRFCGQPGQSHQNIEWFAQDGLTPKSPPQLGWRGDLYGGASPGGALSTVITFEGREMRVIRAGPIIEADLRAVLKP